MLITTSIHIDAPVERVWPILIAFEDYPAWNPLTVRVEGSATVDEVVTLHVQLGGSRMVRKHVISRVAPNEALCWTIRTRKPWLMRGERCQRLEAHEDGGCRYRNEERVEGIASLLVAPLFGRRIRAALEACGEALKRQAEIACSSE